MHATSSNGFQEDVRPKSFKRGNAEYRNNFAAMKIVWSPKKSMEMAKGFSDNILLMNIDLLFKIKLSYILLLH